MRPYSVFDPAHPRCLFPNFGRACDTAIAAKGLNASEVARGIGVSAEIVRGYRRGFSRPSDTTKLMLEQFLGTTFDTSEAPQRTNDPVSLLRSLSSMYEKLVATEEERDRYRAKLEHHNLLPA